VHVTGFNLAGVNGQDFFTPPAAINGAAAGLSLAAGLTTSTIAASSSVATLPGDNSKALAIARLINDTTTTAGATYNSYYTSLVSTIGLDVKTAKNTVAQDEAFTKQLNSLRESNSGVSLDEELTNLVKYQRSYQASAKLINVATEMMDTVINMVR
jgi:flagellar hook-associated protein 1 FlgK